MHKFARFFVVARIGFVRTERNKNGRSGVPFRGPDLGAHLGVYEPDLGADLGVYEHPSVARTRPRSTIPDRQLRQTKFERKIANTDS